MIKVPEFIIHETLQLGLKYIRDNYEGTADKNDTFLRRVLAGNKFERYDFITQAEEVFINNDKSSSRFLDVDLMFNAQRDGAPTIYISLPGEGQQPGGNGMGMDEGYQSSMQIGEDTYPVATRRYKATYDIIITSDNNNEVLLIYHTLKALSLTLSSHMMLSGLQNISFGGGDITIDNRILNRGLYFRAFSISLEYESSAPFVFKDPFFVDLRATGTPINDPNQQPLT